MFGRLGVRGKILAVVAVPILVLVIVAATVTFSAARNLDSARNVEQLLDVVRTSNALATDLQDERANVAGLYDSYTQFVPLRTEARQATDQAFIDFLAVVAAADNADKTKAIEIRQRVLDAIGLQSTTSADGTVSVIPPESVNEDFRTGVTALRVVDIARDPNGRLTAPATDDILDLRNAYTDVAGQLIGITGRTGLKELNFAISRLAGAVTVEGAASGDALDGVHTFVLPLETAISQTDLDLEQFRGAVDHISARDANSALILATKSAVSYLGTLEERRALVRSLNYTSVDPSTWYEQTIPQLRNLSGIIADGITQRQLANRITAFAAVGSLIDAMRAEESFGGAVIRHGAFAQGEAATMKDYQVRTDVALENAQTAAGAAPDSPTLPGFGVSYNPEDRSSFTQVRFALANGDNALIPGLQQYDWHGLVSTEIEESYAPVADQLWQGAITQAQADTRSALLTTLFTALGAALVVLASLFVALFIARGIVRPLRRLTTTATAVRQELPRLVERVALPGQSVDVSEVQIPVESADEVGRLAEAFNAVNAATLAIAGEQAALRGSISEMFVNVARRDQVLLNRQLASIDEMERTQDDADTLVKLFALDHLATRMRRNSESLLVLAGIDSGRRMRRPMPLSDVIRTASSEIELYERVELVLDADPSMVGHSALTAGHMFAELLENATVFSDPDTAVDVHTFEKDGAYVVEVRDKGIGMTPDELRDANARVVSSAASEILGAQRLGLFVVGRIARRIGAKVELQSEEGKGTTAIVTLPRSLFDVSAEPDQASAGSSTSTSDEKLHVPAALVSHSSDEEVDEFDEAGVASAIAKNAAETLGTSPSSQDSSSNDLDGLIESDAASAPTSEEVDLGSLTSGVTAKGLPARRRAPKKAADQPETSTILGLPEHPTTGQLDELSRESEAGGGRVAERRSAMFRGFRARGVDSEPVEIDPEAESLGHEARRSGGVAARTDDPSEKPVEVPALEDVTEDEEAPATDASTEAADDAEPTKGDATEESDAPAPTEVAPDGDVTDNEKADKEAAADEAKNDDVTEEGPSAAKPEGEEGSMAPDWSFGSDPAISRGFDHRDDAFPAANDGDLVLPASSMTVPGLAPEDEGAEQPDSAAATDADPYAAPEYPALATESPSAVPQEAETPAPSLDAVIGSETAKSGTGRKKRRGLFGRRKSEPAAEQPATPAVAPPFPTGAVDSAPTGAAPYEAAAPYETTAPTDAAPYEAAAPGDTGGGDDWTVAEAPDDAQTALADFASAESGVATPTPEVPGFDEGEAEPYHAPASAYQGEVPAVEEPTPTPFGDWSVAPALPSDLGSETPEEIPTVADVDSSALGEAQAFAVPDVSNQETPADEFPVNHDVASYDAPANPDFASPGTAPLEVPPIESVPLGGEAETPQETVDEAVDAVPEIVADGPAPVEAAPEWPALDTEAATDTPDAIPALEEDPPPAPPAAPEYPAPVADQTPYAGGDGYGQEPTPYGQEPAPYGQEPAPYGQEPAPYGQEPAPYGQEPAPYGQDPAYAQADVPGAQWDTYSPDQFAQPYGWEAAGAQALEVAGGEPDYSGYSPEAFSAPPPEEDYDADVASAVFSELSSLSKERPTVQRTRAGLAKRERSAVATAEPAAPAAPAEAKAVERDPESVRANFSGFYTGTTRGRADAAANHTTDVHGPTDDGVQS